MISRGIFVEILNRAFPVGSDVSGFNSRGVFPLNLNQLYQRVFCPVIVHVHIEITGGGRTMIDKRNQRNDNFN